MATRTVEATAEYPDAWTADEFEAVFRATLRAVAGVRLVEVRFAGPNVALAPEHPSMVSIVLNKGKVEGDRTEVLGLDDSGQLWRGVLEETSSGPPFTNCDITWGAKPLSLPWRKRS